MNKLFEEYRREAEYCERRAQEAPNDELRADWLRLAAQWLAMIPNEINKSAEQRFDAAIRDRGTGQEDSTSSH
jgi:hypothetical protein